MNISNSASNQPRNRHERRAVRSLTQKENKSFPKHLVKIDFDEMPSSPEARANGLIEAWRSRDYCVQIYEKPGANTVRMSVNRTDFKGDRWIAGIPWDDLQRLKRECGRGRLEGFEIYPSDDDVVNVANMRHLWIFKGENKLPFGFGRDQPSPPLQVEASNLPQT